jgi:hypothetical protein
LGKEVVEVSHEALIQHWGRLRQWIDEDREFLRTRERIAMAAAYWEENRRDQSLLLTPGRPLAEGLDLLDKRRADLGGSVIEYIERSRDTERQRIETKKKAERRRLRQVKVVAAFITMVLLVQGLAYWFIVGFTERQIDETIAAEIAGLREQYRQRQLPGLIEVVNTRSAVPRTNSLYLVATSTFTPLAGNLSDWPKAEPDPEGWIGFEIADAPEEPDGGSHEARAVVFTLPGGYHLLVGRDLREWNRIIRTLFWALLPTVAFSIFSGFLMSRNMIR